MGLREWANTHPRTVAGVVGVCVLAGVGGVVAQVVGGRHTIRTTAPDHYYTVDDGKTFFAAPGSNVAPFDYQGKTAVRAYVFECGGKQFVGYVERYTPEYRKLEMGPQRGSPDIEVNGRELKRPGDAVWVRSNDKLGLGPVTAVACPGGSSDVPNPIEP